MKRFLTFLGLIILCHSLVAQEKKEHATLSGYIKDFESGETLIGAAVYIESLKVGVTSNLYGFYSLSVPAGKYKVTISYLGYISNSEEISIEKDLVREIEMKPSLVQMKTVTVSSERRDENLKKTEMGMIKMDIKAIKKLPSFMGENDVLRTVQMLPGVQSGGEASTGFFVRGGNSDQNLILLDDAPVYNPSHLLGIFSVFNPDIIKDLTLYKGGIPAKYGGRLSSLLDIKMKEGNSKKNQGAASISPLSSKLTLEGPIIKNRSSFIVSGRRSYADVFTLFSKDEETKDSRVYFYDLNAKANYRINDNNNVFLSGYFGNDVLGIGKELGTSWGNRTGTVRWNHIFNSKLFMNNIVYISNYNFDLGIDTDLEGKIQYKSKILDYGGRADLTYYLNALNTIKFGLSSTIYQLQPGKFTGSSFDDIIIPTSHAREFAGYVSNNHIINEKLAIDYGVRYSLFQNVGKATVYKFDKSNPLVYKANDTVSYKKGNVYNDFGNFEPRISLRYQLNLKSSVKASYNRTTQYLHQASNSTSATPLTVWVTSSPNIKPQISDQFAVGYFRNLFKDVVEVSAEAYYKDMQNTIDFRDNASLILNEFLEGEFRIGNSYSYGVELLVRKNIGKLTGWVGYTWSRTRRKIPEINKGKEFFASYDRTHDISIVGVYELNKRVTLSTNWLFSTGSAISIPTGKYTFQGEQVNVYSDRNSARIPSFHRWDISLTLKTKDKPNRKYQSEWAFSVLNTYFRKNTYNINFRKNEDTGELEAIKTYFFPILPSVAYNIKF
jgi:hypothetical protein